MYDLIVIGGGASGVMASISAKRLGKNVLLIEKNKTIGKKILMTGNGRGNYTNLYVSKNNYNAPYFVEPALNLFSLNDTLDFFYKLGIPYVTEQEEGRCYPASEQASSIVSALEEEIERLKINTLLDSVVTNIYKENDLFNVVVDNNIYKSTNVIISTGGLTYPVTGSNGDGYLFASSFNHSKTETYQGLTRINLVGNFKLVKGVRLTTNMHILNNNKITDSFYGDIIFSDTGVSGIAPFALAKAANDLIYSKKEAYVEIELSNLSKEELENRFKLINYKTVFNSLTGLVPRKLIPLVLKESKINDFDQLVYNLTNNEISKLISTLKHFKFKVEDTGDFTTSQITIGGIKLDEVNKDTLESKIVKGLYFCGEVLDIDSKSGGFNLQWAWSSGYLAGLLL